MTDWELCQGMSDQILTGGLSILRNQEPVEHSRIQLATAGNYLIDLKAESLYIGEAKNLTDRIRQQFRREGSTFFGNFKKMGGDESISIEAFRVRAAATNMGRKELEEFGIVNVPCRLNRFQCGKRGSVRCAATPGLWENVQRTCATLRQEGESAILSLPFQSWSHISPPRSAGLYILRDERCQEILYVGESSDIGERFETHGKRTYFSALRRHIGTDLLGFSLQERNGKAKYFSEVEDDRVSRFLMSCKVVFVPIAFGRYELEEHLIRKYRPQLNRKDNRRGGHCETPSKAPSHKSSFWRWSATEP